MSDLPKPWDGTLVRTWLDRRLAASTLDQAAGIHDDVRFERHVRAHLRKIARMTKTNEGFEKTLHFQ